MFVALCVDCPVGAAFRVSRPPTLGKGALRRLFRLSMPWGGSGKPLLLETGAKNGQSFLSHRTAGDTREIGLKKSQGGEESMEGDAVAGHFF